MLSILATLIALSVLILVHEFGHFFAAKSVGIYAPRFSLGLGPRVTGFKVGETEFVVSAIPLGGYVKMAGMEDDEALQNLEGGAEQEVVPPERTFDAKPLWARTWVISAGVIMNLLFALLANIVLMATQGEPYVSTNRVEPVAGQGVSAQVAAVPQGATVVGVNGTPVQHWTELQDVLTAAPAGPARLELRGAAPVTLDLPPAGARRDTLQAALQPFSDAVLTQVNRDGAAYRAGLRSGDRILTVNGQPVSSATSAVEGFRANPGRAVRVEVERGGQRQTYTVTPRGARERVEGQRRTVGKIGAVFMPTTDHRRVGFGSAITLGAEQTWYQVKLLLTILKQLFTGELSPRNLGGLLAIGEASGESARMGAAFFLGFLALLSVNLAVLNLLPIPILDGGHLMFLLIEAVRGRPLSVEARIRLSHVGLIIVVALMLWANGNDVVRFIERYLNR